MKVWYVTSMNGTCTDYYHTDPDCSRLARAHNTRSAERRHVEANRELCKYCSGEVSNDHEQDGGYHKALRDADPDVV